MQEITNNTNSINKELTENHSVWLALIPWCTCIVGLVVQYHQMIFSGLGQMHSGLGDGRLVNFTLEHGYRWLRQMPLHKDFWRAPIFFPYPTASAYTDFMLGFAPPYWLARLLGAAPDTALQWWMFCVYILNFLAAYFLLRKGLKLAVITCTACALLMAIISVAWSSHLQLFPFFYMLLALLALFRIFDQGDGAPGIVARRGWVIVFATCFVLQVWAAVYAFLFFGLLVFIAGLVALSFPKVRCLFIPQIRRDAMTWGLVALLSVAAMSPLLSRYGTTAEESGFRNYTKAAIAQPYSWIVAGSNDRLLGWLHKSDGPLSEKPHSQGIGLLTFCIAIAGLLAYRRSPSILILSLSTLILMVLGTRYGDFSPWKFIHDVVPGAGGIRAQFRITMIIIPAAIIGVALACHHALHRRRRWLAAFLVSLCIVEHFHTRGTVDKYFIREHIASISEQVNPQYKAFLLVGNKRKARWVADDAAWVALSTGVPTINGRYGNFPNAYEIRRYDVLGEDRNKDIDDSEARYNLEMALQEWLNYWGVERIEVQWIEFEPLTAENTMPHRMR